jgi:rhodanese-related sulfurtransferase
MNKKAFIGAGIFAVILLIGLGIKVVNSTFSQTSSGTWEKINQEQMLEEMEKDNMIIVDLRETELYTDFHIPGAINIPFAEFQERYRELENVKRIVFVCHTGPMGDASSQFLLQNGYGDLANLRGGMAQWNGPVTGK